MTTQDVRIKLSQLMEVWNYGTDDPTELHEDLIKTLQDAPGLARVPAEDPAEDPQAEDPPAEVQAAAEPDAAEQEEQEHQEEEHGRLLDVLQEQRARLREVKTKDKAKKEEKKKRNPKNPERNLGDRTRYWQHKMAGLEDQLLRARRRGQDWLVTTTLEEMAAAEAGAARAG